MGCFKDEADLARYRDHSDDMDLTVDEVFDILAKDLVRSPSAGEQRTRAAAGGVAGQRGGVTCSSKTTPACATQKNPKLTV